MEYRCWTVNCKSEECGVCLTLDLIGPVEKYREPLLPALVPFPVKCCECLKEHTYNATDVTARTVESQSQPQPHTPFRHAIALAESMGHGSASIAP